MLRLLGPILRFLLDNRRDLPKMRIMTTGGRLVLSRCEDAGADLDDAALLSAIEHEIDAFWRSVPFHTLFLGYAMPIESSPHGGTCSDRAILFHARLTERFGARLKARLHRCRINGRETHTAILVRLRAGDYLIDVGSNWPVMRPIPCFERSAFSAFGIQFRAVPEGSMLHVEMKRPEQQEFRPFLSADLTPQSRAQVQAAIADRYSGHHELPFAGKLRFACIHGEAFYTLRDEGFTSGDVERTELWKAHRAKNAGTALP
ncbi:arylamine N-acetyltransferase [Rhodovulum sulfidophilum]|uniref:arylamine N-acetyltransferase n=1 Tax=Rhodovulum sulfidophilum TaxID=35806 RepID=UPI001923BEC9|nr:arylamine N-acetyltransferase [Rhodovulum sulfidophilum]MBL3562894.1 arylamine N-acetyltransferase [Rhodovulum sulfidophilum]